MALSRVRQREVLAHLRSHGAGQVAELAAALDVSPSTIRRDLKEMEERGLLTRLHGGASVSTDDVEAVRGARQHSHHQAKRRIGAAAASRVAPGSTVLITGGTTTEAMLPFLAEVENLTVVTNGLDVAHQLTRCPHVVVVVLGGVLRHQEMSLLGPLAEQALADLNVDGAFVGAFGLDAATGLSGVDVREAQTDRALLRSARTLTVLADSSKFSQRGPVRLAPVEKIDCVVTDDGAPPDAVHALHARGVEVVRV